MHEHIHESPSITPVSALPAQAQAPTLELHELVDSITRSITAIVPSAPSFQSQSADANKSYERARKFGEIEFQGFLVFYVPWYKMLVKLSPAISESFGKICMVDQLIFF